MFVPSRLSAVSGEFEDAAVERAFRDDSFPEAARQARLLFAMSTLLNTLFLTSDWRFHGTPHFFVAIPARSVVIAIAVIAFLGARRCIRFAALQRWLVAWQWITGLAVGALVTSRSDIALFVVIMLPSIFYLVVPAGFTWTAIGGIGASVTMLLCYVLPDVAHSNALGLVLAMIMLNCALLLVVTRSNRMRRMEWSAIRAERQARARLAESQRMLEAVFASLPIPLIVGNVADGRIICANAAAQDYFGPKGDAASRSLADIRMDLIERARFRRLLAEERPVSGFEASVRASDGTKRDLLISAASVDGGGVASVVISGVDITERKAAVARLERLARTDALTGVANRSHLFACATAEIRRAARYRRALSVLMVDLDHFKRVNDEFGHAVGDVVLVEFAQICGRLLRAEDLIARYGGEEFVALLPETDGQGALAVAERLRDAASQIRIAVAPASRRVTVSIGVASLRPGETAIETVLARADEALYDAKAAGRDRIVVAPPATEGQAA
jgi:diguanylate cyclase (GGDEF)-like protein/PAS domain S-box-containing protein